MKVEFSYLILCPLFFFASQFVFTDTEGNMTGMKRPNGGLSMLELGGLIGIGVFLLIVTTLLTVLSLYLIRKKS